MVALVRPRLGQLQLVVALYDLPRGTEHDRGVIELFTGADRHADNGIHAVLAAGLGDLASAPASCSRERARM